VADPRVQVRVGDGEGDATARVLEAGSDEDALARRLLLAKYQRPGQDDLVDWARTGLPVALDLAFDPPTEGPAPLLSPRRSRRARRGP
jgi:hypothetical protein